MENKTVKAISLYQRGFLKESLSIFKTFKIGFTKNEKRILEITSDCLNGRSSFYKQLGVNVDNIINECLIILKSKYSL